MFVVNGLVNKLIELGIEFDTAINLNTIVFIGVAYLPNIAITIFIISDLLKNKIKGIPIGILSVFSYFAGIIFFLFLINNKINNNDK